jgi:hypothetical protein
MPLTVMRQTKKYLTFRWNKVPYLKDRETDKVYPIRRKDCKHMRRGSRHYYHERCRKIIEAYELKQTQLKNETTPKQPK